MTASVTSLSSVRQQRGLPPAMPAPRTFIVGDRVRVTTHGNRVTYIRDAVLNARRTAMTYGVMLDGRVVSVDAAELVADDPTPPRAA